MGGFLVDAFVRRLRELGYIEGKNVAIGSQHRDACQLRGLVWALSGTARHTGPAVQSSRHDA